MSRVLRWIACVVVLGAGSGCQLFLPGEEGTLAVVVRGSQGEGVPNVSIEVYHDVARPDLGDNLAASGTTNEAGRVEFDLEEGQYIVRVASSSYELVFPYTEERISFEPPNELVSFEALGFRSLFVYLQWAEGSDSIEGPDVLVEVLDEDDVVRGSRRMDWRFESEIRVPSRRHSVRVSDYPNWISFEETVLEADASTSEHVRFRASYVGERTVVAVVTDAVGVPIEDVTVDFLDETTRERRAGGVTNGIGEVTWASAPVGRIVAVLSGFDPAQHTFPNTEIALEVADPPGLYVARFEAEAAMTNQPPVASIITPTDGTVFSQGQPATFTGTGVDAEDGFLTGSALVWNSSLDGPMGTGESVTVSTLQPGGHEITLTATDTDAAVDTDTINVKISASGTATIQGAVTISGAGFASIRVTATGPTLAATVTDPFGNYTLGGLAAGTYTVTVSEYPSDFTFNPASVTVTVADGATVTQDFMGSGG